MHSVKVAIGQQRGRAAVVGAKRWGRTIHERGRNQNKDSVSTTRVLHIKNVEHAHQASRRMVPIVSCSPQAASACLPGLDLHADVPCACIGLGSRTERQSSNRVDKAPGRSHTRDGERIHVVPCGLDPLFNALSSSTI